MRSFIQSLHPVAKFFACVAIVLLILLLFVFSMPLIAQWPEGRIVVHAQYPNGAPAQCITIAIKPIHPATPSNKLRVLAIATTTDDQGNWTDWNTLSPGEYDLYFGAVEHTTHLTSQRIKIWPLQTTEITLIVDNKTMNPPCN
jgi:hypothetical protein